MDEFAMCAQPIQRRFIEMAESIIVIMVSLCLAYRMLGSGDKKPGKMDTIEDIHGGLNVFSTSVKILPNLWTTTPCLTPSFSSSFRFSTSFCGKKQH